MLISRRWFVGALAGAVAAPMIVKATSIMPVKVWLPPPPVFPEMSFSIEKISVTAKSRALKATYTMELDEDLQCMYENYAATTLSEIMQREIDNEIIKKICNKATSFDEFNMEWIPPWT